MNFFQEIQKYLLLVADNKKIADHFIFLCFQNKFITCSLWTLDGKKAKM